MNISSGDSRFHTTLWSVVLRAGNGDDVPKQSALDHLCQLYWKPLFVYCLGQGRSREDAEDLTQGFFAYILAKDSLRIADPNRGRFRSFLLTSFKNYIFGEVDRSRAARRGNGALHLSFDVNFNESTLCPSAAGIAPEMAFDRQWAKDLVSRATAALRSEIEATGKNRWFDLVADTGSAASYAVVAAELGTTEEAVKSFAKRTRRRFREILEASIADTVGSPEELAGEMSYIANLLRG